MSQHAYSKIEINEIKLDWGRIEYSSKTLDVETFDLISFDDNLVFYYLFAIRKISNFQQQLPHLTQEKLRRQNKSS
jgi:hypothetical protein